jgi:hypothetical protein
MIEPKLELAAAEVLTDCFGLFGNAHGAIAAGK